MLNTPDSVSSTEWQEGYEKKR